MSPASAVAAVVSAAGGTLVSSTAEEDAGGTGDPLRLRDLLTLRPRESDLAGDLEGERESRFDPRRSGDGDREGDLERLRRLGGLGLLRLDLLLAESRRTPT
jgi:hypothetical protein